MAERYPPGMPVKLKSRSFCTLCAPSVSRCETRSLNDKLGNAPCDGECTRDYGEPMKKNVDRQCVVTLFDAVMGDAVP